MSEQVDLLAPLRELLSVPERWTQNAFGKTKDGIISDTFDPDTVCWCLQGAKNRVYPRGELRTRIYDELYRRTIKFGREGIFNFNDGPTTTHADIVGLLSEPFYGAECSLDKEPK